MNSASSNVRGACFSSNSKLYWNREEDACTAGDALEELKKRKTVEKKARIVSLSNPDDDACRALHHTAATNTTDDESVLPRGCSLLGVGSTAQELGLIKDVNVVFVSPSSTNAKQELPLLIKEYGDSLEWIHLRSAGIDFIHSHELVELCEQYNIQVTNAKGQFSSVLAEYTIMSCLYFAKNLPRLLQQQSLAKWQKYNVKELRGSTLGIVGYGDIGRATAKLAKAMGMNILAFRRNTTITTDKYCDSFLNPANGGLHELMKRSDYVLCSAPLTRETHHLIDATALSLLQPHAVLINVGRGPVVDQNAMVQNLQNGKLAGAALDVFDTEPLPSNHPLWKLPNVLLSPHNMDQTPTFMHEATDFFLDENLPRFILQKTLFNPVNMQQGY